MTDDRVPERLGCVRKGHLAGKPAEGCGDPEASDAPEPSPDWICAFDPNRAKTIDVRPILASHGEPFAAVMSIVNALPAEAGLIIDAPFNPLPLRRVLGQMGFATYGQRLLDDHWRIWCVPEIATSGSSDTATAVRGAAVWTAADGVHIDVRGLPAPAPLHAILTLIDQGHHEGMIVVHHEREPLFLFPELAERGWTHASVEGESGEVRLVLRREPG